MNCCGQVGGGGGGQKGDGGRGGVGGGRIQATDGYKKAGSQTEWHVAGNVGEYILQPDLSPDITTVPTSNLFR